MKLPEIKNSEVVIFKPQDGQSEFQVVLDCEHDTVWVTEQQMMTLFGKARRTIEYHIKNIYEEGELNKESTWRDFRQVQKEGEREVARKVSVYNLDVIISVGYRVKSQIGIEFRKWATQRLKEYLLKGYSLNQELLHNEQKKVATLQQEINQLNNELIQTQKTLTDGLLSIIEQYSKSFELLDKYDKDKLSSENLNGDLIYIINYADVKNAIQRLKSSLITKGEASDLFGNEKDDSFKGILGSVSQTVFGELAYPTIEEQAVQLLYSIIKGRPFNDGNKRIGSFIFVWYLEQNGHHLSENGDRKINDNTLVTLAIAVAQSLPEQRETVQKLIMNLIKN
jgi:prophage maintenance system killer protein